MSTNATSAEATDSNLKYDFMNGVYDSTGSNSAYYGWMWKRAPGYFDVCCYTGDGTTSNTQSHNLGVAPELMIIRRRDAVEAWQVPALITSSGYRNMRLDTTYEGQAISSYSDYTGLQSQPTSTQFVLGQNSQTNANGGAFIAYLFATVAGVSKVGSYTGDSSDGKIIDCGFSSGARFVLIKCTTTVGDWFVFDTVRGIVEGNDAKLALNSTDAEVSSYDYVEPHSSGFKVNTIGSAVNGSGKTFIFYAIA